MTEIYEAQHTCVYDLVDDDLALSKLSSIADDLGFSEELLCHHFLVDKCEIIERLSEHVLDYEDVAIANLIAARLNMLPDGVLLDLCP